MGLASDISSDPSSLVGFAIFFQSFMKINKIKERIWPYLLGSSPSSLDPGSDFDTRCSAQDQLRFIFF